MISVSNGSGLRVGLLLSGGLDSCVLLAHLVAQGHRVQPFYVDSNLVWQPCEQAAARRFLAAVDSPQIDELVTLALPLEDLYTGHWSISGEGVPGADSPDSAVYLPGRNALLLVKVALWCHLHGVDQLALAPLKSNPFADATAAFFEEFASAINRAASGRLKITVPFADLDKREVMLLGRDQPLELTFSCIAPRAGRHCGRCNKCAERQRAFRSIGRADTTRYHGDSQTVPHGAA